MRHAQILQEGNYTGTEAKDATGCLAVMLASSSSTSLQAMSGEVCRETGLCEGNYPLNWGIFFCGMHASFA